MLLQNAAKKTQAPITNALHCEAGHLMTGSPFGEPSEHGHGCLDPHCRHHVCILVEELVPECAHHKHVSPLTGPVGQYREGCDGTASATAFCSNGHYMVSRPSGTGDEDLVGCIHPVCRHAVERAHHPRNAAERKMAGTLARTEPKTKVPNGGRGRMPARFWLTMQSKPKSAPAEAPEPVVNVSPAPGIEVSLHDVPITILGELVEDHSATASRVAVTTEAA